MISDALLLKLFISLSGIPSKEFNESLGPQISQVVTLHGDKGQWQRGALYHDGLILKQLHPVGPIHAHPGAVATICHLLYFYLAIGWQD